MPQSNERSVKLGHYLAPALSRELARPLTLLCSPGRFLPGQKGRLLNDVLAGSAALLLSALPVVGVMKFVVKLVLGLEPVVQTVAAVISAVLLMDFVGPDLNFVQSRVVCRWVIEGFAGPLPMPVGRRAFF